MPRSYDDELRIGIEAVRSAGGLCQHVQRSITPDVLAKKDRSPVTVADYGSQALVCRALHEAFADDPIVAEEDSSELRAAENSLILDRVVQHVGRVRPEADHSSVCAWIDRGRTRSFSERFWTLDPIDGTKGFLRGEQYAIALALIVRGHIQLAILGCPNLPAAAANSGETGSIFFAMRGSGAMSQPLNGGRQATHLRVSSHADAADCRFCESVESGHSAHGDAAAVARRLGISHEPIRMDSQTKYAVVARGDAQIYMRMPTGAGYEEKIWDHAGGALIVSEAGGTVSDINGKPLDFTHGTTLALNHGVIATNGHVHGRVIEALRDLGLQRT